MYQRLYKGLFSRSFFLFGARGTGKTSLLKRHFSQSSPLLWLDLLDVDLERFVSAGSALAHEKRREKVRVVRAGELRGGFSEFE